MKLYSYWRSSSAWRVRLALEIKGIDYTCVPVNLAKGAAQQHSPAYTAVNALQQIPVLEWEQDGALLRLGQSVAIIEYLEERWPRPALLPSEPLARARVRQAVQIVNSGIQPLQNSGVLAEIERLAGVAAVEPWAQTFIERGLSALEQHALFCAGRCLEGDSLSMADLYLVPQLYNARRFHLDVARFPRLLAIETQLNARADFARARPEAQPDAVA